MKKAAIIFGLIFLGVTPVFADEAPAEQSANDNKAVIAVQKQPANSIQKQEIKQNKWCIIIQVNGKRERAEGEEQVDLRTAGQAGSADPLNASRAREIKEAKK